MESYFAHRQITAPEPAGGAHAFQPLFSVLGASPILESRGGSTTLDPDSAAPQIELVHAEGRISKIVVTCRCCERIELDCEY